MTNDEQGSELYAALIGEKRRDYYLKRFESFDDRGGGFIPSWNWAAFFFGGLWALYRKMYAVFFVVLGISFISEIIDAPLSLDSPLYDFIYLVLLLFGFGIYGNALYYRHTKGKIAKARTTLPETEKLLSYIRSKGGVHVWVIWIFLLIPIAGILAAIAIPAYQDYTIRAQVSEGFNLARTAQAAVTEHFDATGELVANNETAGLELPDRLSGKYVSSLAVDGGSIIIAYGNEAHVLIDGQTIVLTPEIQPNNLLNWTCSSQSIRPQHLPAACR